MFALFDCILKSTGIKSSHPEGHLTKLHSNRGSSIAFNIIHEVCVPKLNCKSKQGVPFEWSAINTVGKAISRYLIRRAPILDKCDTELIRSGSKNVCRNFCHRLLDWCIVNDATLKKDTNLLIFTCVRDLCFPPISKAFVKPHLGDSLNSFIYVRIN